MTLFRSTVIDVGGDPFVDDPTAALREGNPTAALREGNPTAALREGNPTAALRADADGAVVVRDGTIVARGGYHEVRRGYPGERVVDLRPGVLFPGFVDAHVHFPQVRVIGGLGMSLLDWLERCALPEEVRLADRTYAESVAEELLSGLVRAGTTSALVFGSHFAPAVDALFVAAARSGLRITAGQVLSDRALPVELLTTPQQGLVDGLALIERWHGHGRLRYVVTPRFSLSTTEAMLEACAELARTADVAVTSHLNEQAAEMDRVAASFPGRRHYLDTYHHFGLVTPRTVLAHNVHPSEHELELLGETGAWVAHCPTSNAALGSGLFPFRRHRHHRVGVALGSDVGAGTGFSLLKEGLQAYFAQQLLGRDGLALTSAHLLYLATRAGAQALGLADRVGDLSVGRQFDAVWISPEPGSTLEVVLRHATDPEDVVAKVFALGTSADVAGVWVDGRQLYQGKIEPGAAPGPTSEASKLGPLAPLAALVDD